MTSVWKKLATLLRKGSDCAATLPALSLKACMRGQATLKQHTLSGTMQFWRSEAVALHALAPQHTKCMSMALLKSWR